MRKWFPKLLGVALIVASFTLGWILIDFQQFLRDPVAPLEAARTYTVAPGAGLIAVARDLERQGLIRHPRYLLWYARWRGVADDIKAGEYLIAPETTPPQFLDKLSRGDVIQYSLTIPEGWTFAQLMAAVNRHEKLVHTLADRDAAEIMAALGLPGQHPEGRFFPDTYYFAAGTTDVAFLRRAHQAMEERLAAEWADRAPGLPYKTPYEALILASIIEKETAVPEERRRIAGVFVRRLQRGMRLQTDPTVIYGLGEDYDGNLRRRDLRTDSPYNTYLRRGLPPTPIALPGAAALHAALHPEPGDALYFVARGDGTHHFSATVAEHNAAVKSYQLDRRTTRHGP